MDQAEDSILQVCQLAELKQTKEWERYPNRFRRLCETLMPENLGKHCREWPAGKTVKLLIEENSKPQDLIVYSDGSVTKDQSGWGFTVKQGATTIHNFVISNRILQNYNKHKTSSLFYLCSTALSVMHRQCCLTVTVLCSLMAPTYWGHGPGFPGVNGTVDALFLYRFSYPLVAENQPVKAGPRLQLLDRTS